MNTSNSNDSNKTLSKHPVKNFAIGVFVILIFLIGHSLFAQVGIGTTNPNASSALDIESSDKGILIPRMTVSERLAIATPADGLMVYQTNDVIGFYFYDGSSWDRLLKESKDPVPTGAIFSFPLETPPVGYLVCDGSAVSRTTYAELFAVLGTTYGSGDGSTTFNLPDYRGKFLRGYDDGAGNDPDAATRQDRGDGTTGDAVGTTQDAEMASHLHEINTPSSTSGFSGNHSHSVNSFGVATSNAGGHQHIINPTTTTTSTSGNHSHQVRGVEGNIDYSTFSSPDFVVDDFGTSGPDVINTTTTGNHFHTVNIPALNTNSTGIHSHTITIPSFNTNASVNHSHTINIPAFNSSLTGSSETRPVNISVVYCIKY
ncbi:MAG: phage tail protein [Winogradskyella sp.]|jgi:microcystin-dependent protein